jgi:4-aminobutyrate aminotransferase/(S)-3-amino-2-methylpropionate transaminase
MGMPDVTIPPPGPRAKALVERQNAVFSEPWAKKVFYPLWIDEARDSRVRDVDGNWYLDFMASDYNLGSCHPAVAKAMQEQSGKLILTLGASAQWEPFVALSERLRNLAPGHLRNGKIASASGGSEIIELATLMVRYVKKRPVILVYVGGFHGTLPITIQMTSRHSRFRAGNSPAVHDTIAVPYPYCYRCPLGLTYPECGLACADKLTETLERLAPPSDVAALVFETIQVPAGYIIPPPGYWEKIAAICKEHDILLVADEIATGMGRTGKMFAIEHYNFVPDVICLAKSLAWGAPLSAMIGRADLMDAWDSGIGVAPLTSMGGHPVSCAAALAGLDVVEREGLLKNANARGAQFVAGLRSLAEEYEEIGDIRSVGLLTGIELVRDRKTKVAAREEALKICREALNRGLIMGVYGLWDSVLRFFPPLIVTQEQIDKALSILADSFKAVLRRRR